MCLTVMVMEWWNRDRLLVESVVSGPGVTTTSAQSKVSRATASNPAQQPASATLPPEDDTSSVDLPKLVKRVAPQYTADALSRKVEGTVGLSFFVMPSGYVRTIRVIHPLDPGLDHSAIEAVSHWHYTPALVDGHPATVQITADIDFHLP